MYKLTLNNAIAIPYHAPYADVNFMKAVMFLYKSVRSTAWLPFANERP
jgi:hypothetical protein